MASTGENVTRADSSSVLSRRRLANAVRVLALDAVEQAKSGHPGMPMGMADVAEVLWNDYLVYNPANTEWFDRDRFVLSNGHGSMLLYAVLHLTGFPLGIDEIRRFRQLGSRTAGHPEREPHIGIETTTGPLGQGLANAVGMALAEKVLAAAFNRDEHEIVDHYTYVVAGDGCLMEGVSHEAASLAGTLGLGKLIALWDDNGISIDGKTEGWFTDDTPARFRAYGWHVVQDVDGHDAEAVKAAIDAARSERARPSLICCRTTIGYGAPTKQGTAATHGAPLGPEEAAAAREALGWEHPPFVVPDDIKQAWDHTDAGRSAESEWQARFERYRAACPELAAELERRMRGELPDDWAGTAERAVREIAGEAKAVATRVASQRSLDAFAPHLPELLGGSADLTGSNNTLHSGSKVIGAADPGGNYLHYGVREFGMAAIMNGVALHGGFIPYGGTFLVFSDYARNGMRMASLMGTRSIFVLTHDSIGLGEDGPTHQPVEHLTGLRAIPGMTVWRPCDAVETAVAWRDALERRDGPTCLVLTRQSLPHVPRTEDQIELIRRGGYILSSGAEAPRVVLIATGSEVALALSAADELRASGIAARVVSMPCVSLFDGQSEEYRSHVLPPAAARVVIEAGATDGWWRYVGNNGDVIGLDRFGASAPAKDLFEHYGFTVEHIAAVARRFA